MNKGFVGNESQYISFLIMTAQWNGKSIKEICQESGIKYNRLWKIQNGVSNVEPDEFYLLCQVAGKDETEILGMSLQQVEDNITRMQGEEINLAIRSAEIIEHLRSKAAEKGFKMADLPHCFRGPATAQSRKLNVHNYIQACQTIGIDPQGLLKKIHEQKPSPVWM